MADNGQSEYITVIIDANLATGELTVELPQNFLMALRMLETAREVLLMQRVRPAFAPKVQGAVTLPAAFPGRS